VEVSPKTPPKVQSPYKRKSSPQDYTPPNHQETVLSPEQITTPKKQLSSPSEENRLAKQDTPGSQHDFDNSTAKDKYASIVNDPNLSPHSSN
jgi:hypothetical protein